MKKANTEPGASNTLSSDQSSTRAKDLFNFQYPISMHSDFDGYGFSLSNMTGFAASMVWLDDAGSADPSGTAWLEASNSSAEAWSDIDPDTWVKIADSDATVSLRGIKMWNHRNVFFRWVRLRYKRTSGDGNAWVRFNAKGF